MYSQRMATQAGKVTIRSGATGNILLPLTGSSMGDFLGSDIADAGDLDSDGLSDFIMGAGSAANGGAVYVYSQSNQLFMVNGASVNSQIGNVVANAGDVDNDGVEDFMSSDPNNYSFANGSFGRVVVWSGATGNVIHQIDYLGAVAFGQSLVGLGDLDGDGHDDFAVGAPLDNYPSIIHGKVHVYSGNSGTVLYSLLGIYGQFGTQLANIGDIDNDGIDDLAVGNHNYSVGGFGGFQGMVQVWSGASGAFLYDVVGAPGDYLGVSVAGCDDVNGDGVGDMLIGAAEYATTGDGYTNIVDGTNGNYIDSVSSSNSDQIFGCAVACIGDVNNDGSPEFIVGARDSDNSYTNSGSAYVFSDVNIPPPSAWLRAQGSAGSTMLLGVTQAPTFTPFRIAYSFAGINSSGQIITNISQSILRTTDVTGEWLGAVQVPAGWAGLTIYIQALNMNSMAPTNIVTQVL